jgi:hypothetical protein
MVNRPISLDLFYGILCPATLGLVWLPVIHYRGGLLYPLCPCEHFQTLVMSIFVTEPELRMVLTSFHVLDVRVTVNRDKFLIIKPTRCTNFSNLFLEGNSTCFGQFLCPSSGVSHCTHSNGICHTGLLTACEQDQDRTFWSCCVNSEELLMMGWGTPDDGQRNCPKHAEFPSKNKTEKLVHLVGFIVRNHFMCFTGHIPHTYTNFYGNALLHFQVPYGPRTCQGPSYCEHHTHCTSCGLSQTYTHAAYFFYFNFDTVFSTRCTHWLKSL